MRLARGILRYANLVSRLDDTGCWHKASDGWRGNRRAGLRRRSCRPIGRSDTPGWGHSLPRRHFSRWCQTARQIRHRAGAACHQRRGRQWSWERRWQRCTHRWWNTTWRVWWRCCFWWSVFSAGHRGWREMSTMSWVGPRISRFKFWTDKK